MAGAISQDEQAPNRGVLIIKKSILERFSWRAFFGQKEKSFRPGKNNRYGSVRLWLVHSSCNSPECRAFGSCAMFLQSILSVTGSELKVQFQSPPKITGHCPSFRMDRSSFLKKPGL